ncbi:MAG TPA: UDP-N-acetylglucosamine 2-epimerase (non-hydrolyzing) [Gaiellales bacterium]|nr:UDP-N-acetylglucosamine 2-epimerase (non-hydrolyzing) [Gaiellales bacterium]
MKVVSVVGNRPQFVKAAPVAAAIAERADHLLVHTGQHYDDDLSQIFFDELGLPPPGHRIPGPPEGGHARQTAAMMSALEPLLTGEAPDLTVVYGDTNSTLAGALTASKAGLRLAHVEAGLRSFDRSMPEELNRVVTDVLSDVRLCPSETAVANLAAEGIQEGVHLVGDVMVDAARVFGPVAASHSDVLERFGVTGGNYAVVTVHRQANTEPAAMPQLVEVLEAIPMPVVFPIHPRTAAALRGAGQERRAGAAAILADPLGYLDFTALLAGAAVCLTDSGGVQKEAYLQRVPCITLRDTSEWVETVEAGWNQLAGGLDAGRVARALATLERPDEHPLLYGDGHAAERIAAILCADSIPVP